MSLQYYRTTKLVDDEERHLIHAIDIEAKLFQRRYLQIALYSDSLVDLETVGYF